MDKIKQTLKIIEKKIIEENPKIILNTKYNNKIILIGGAHVSKKTINLVEAIFNKENPDIVALELDNQRLIGMLNKNKKKQKSSILNLFKFGFFGYLFALIGKKVQSNLGNLIGIEPGSEMLKAYNLALKNNKNLVLIDIDINTTLKKLSKSFNFKTKIKFLFSIFKKQEIDIDNFVDSTILFLKENFPSLYKVLIEDRNKFMANNLIELSKYGNVMTVVGLGHIKGIVEILEQQFKNKEIRNNQNNKINKQFKSNNLEFKESLYKINNNSSISWSIELNKE